MRAEKMSVESSNIEVVEKYKNDDVLRGDYFKNSSKVDIPETGVYPLKIDNRQLCSPTDYQGNMPWCVGYSCAQLLEAYIWKYKGVLKNLDAAQIYAKAKERDKMMNVGGTYVDLGLRCAMELCGEELVSKWFMPKTSRSKSSQTVKRVLHMNDFAIAGFSITQDWYHVTNEDFIIKGEEKTLGGHAVVICGYDQTGVYIQNHWGIGWGAKGFAILPWDLYERELSQLCWLECKQ